MPTDKIKIKIIELILELFKNNGFDADIIEHIDLIDDGRMDSIIFISVVIEIEEKFNIIIPDDVLLMENFRTVDNIVAIVKRELGLKFEEDEVNNDVEA